VTALTTELHSKQLKPVI